MKYLLLVCADEGLEHGSEDERQDFRRRAMAWIEEMDERGIRLRGDRLRPTSDATTVQVRKGEVLVADGPFAETKEQIGGFDLLECKDLDEAIEVASKHPVAELGTIEIRPFYE